MAEGPPPLPTAAQLTDWLRAAGSLPAGRVAGLRGEEIGTFSAHLCRLHLRYEGGPAGPERLILKSSIPGRPDRPGEGMANEIRFYRELAPQLSVRTPRFHGGGLDATGRGWLLVEDVPGIEPTDWLRGPDEGHAHLAVAALARVHAARWDDVNALDWVPGLDDPELLASFEAAYAAGWSSHREWLLESVPAFAEIGDALVGRVASSHRALFEEATLLHGDAHAENLPLCAGPDGREVVALDWAGPRRGNAGVDLGFFVPMSLPPGRRRGLERALVAHHREVLLEVLRSRGLKPRLDAWQAYRRGVLRRVCRIVEIAPRWDRAALASLRMIFHRCATAAVDLDLGELID